MYNSAYHYYEKHDVPPCRGQILPCWTSFTSSTHPTVTTSSLNQVTSMRLGLSTLQGWSTIPPTASWRKTETPSAMICSAFWPLPNHCSSLVSSRERKLWYIGGPGYYRDSPCFVFLTGFRRATRWQVSSQVLYIVCAINRIHAVFPLSPCTHQ